MITRIGRSAGTLGSCAIATLLAFAASGTTTRAADRAEAPGAEPSSQIKFSLLPKSFQPRPSLDFHIITELTAEGRKLATPAADKPVYYLAKPGEFTLMGENNRSDVTPPDLRQLTRAMEAALASSHYAKASPSTPLPVIAVAFNYGSFARFSMEMHDQPEDLLLEELVRKLSPTVDPGPMFHSDQRDAAALLPIVLSHKMERDDVLRRATVIGGEKFADDLAKALTNEVRSRTGDGNAIPGGPFEKFMTANEKLVMLVEDSFNSCYFVIASAFDYQAMRKGQRVLLWRTKMTVNSSGISMAESLPALMRTAGPYLGKDMTEAVTVTRKVLRGGKVELGELRVIEGDVPTPGASEPGTSPAPAPTAPPEGALPKR